MINDEWSMNIVFKHVNDTTILSYDKILHIETKKELKDSLSNELYRTHHWMLGLKIEDITCHILWGRGAP